MPGVGPIRQWGFDIDSYRRLLANDLERELDYRCEAERQAHMQRELRVAGLVIPRVYPDLCHEDLLVQSFETGVSLADFAKRSPDNRVAAAEILVRTLFHSLFVVGEIHADPHVGNMLFRAPVGGGAEVALLDWGCTLSLERPRRLALLKLILAAQAREEIDLLATFVALGFDAEKLQPMEASLAALCPILFAPFLVEQRLNASTWQLAERLERLLGEHRWWFRAAGPADLLLMLRAFGGLMQNLAALSVALPWRELLEEVVSPELCDEARRFVPEPLPAQVEACRQRRGFSALAKALKVEVLENGRPKVSISMPAEVGLRLESVVPEDVLEMVVQAGVDVAALTERVRESGIAPQPLIDLEKPPKHYRVWLE